MTFVIGAACGSALISLLSISVAVRRIADVLEKRERRESSR